MEVGQILRFVEDGVLPEDSKVQSFVFGREIDLWSWKVLYYVDTEQK